MENLMQVIQKIRGQLLSKSSTKRYLVTAICNDNYCISLRILKKRIGGIQMYKSLKIAVRGLLMWGGYFMEKRPYKHGFSYPLFAQHHPVTENDQK